MKDLVKAQIKAELEKLQFVTSAKFYIVKVFLLSLILGTIACGTFSLSVYSIKLGTFLCAKYGWFWATNFYLAEIVIIASLILAGLIEDE